MKVQKYRDINHYGDLKGFVLSTDEETTMYLQRNQLSKHEWNDYDHNQSQLLIGGKMYLPIVITLKMVLVCSSSNGKWEIL